MAHNSFQDTSANQPDGQQHQVGERQSFSKFFMTQDEIRVARECNSESLYYRCIPFATFFSGLAYIGMKNGYMKKSIKYGYGPKMILGAFLGYIGGKFSYQSVCVEKMMNLPNSQLGEALRRRKGLASLQESSEPGFALESPAMEYQKESLTLEERRPDLSEHNDGMDSYNTVTESLLPYAPSETSEPKSFVSYDDLRRQNREEYVSKMSEKYRKQTLDTPYSGNLPSSFPEQSNFPTDSTSRPTQDSRPPSYSNPKKNKYGDVWDD